jgi:hypothetical protein
VAVFLRWDIGIDQRFRFRDGLLRSQATKPTTLGYIDVAVGLAGGRQDRRSRTGAGAFLNTRVGARAIFLFCDGWRRFIPLGFCGRASDRSEV